MELELSALDGGSATRLGVRAQPGARRPGVVGLWNGHVKVAVGAPPDRGRANAELLEVLAAALGLRASQLSLLRGERARLKVLRVEAPPARVRERLLALLG